MSLVGSVAALSSHLVADIAVRWLDEGRLDEVRELIAQRADLLADDRFLMETAVRLAVREGADKRTEGLLDALLAKWPPAEMSDDILLLEVDRVRALGGRRAQLALLSAAGEGRGTDVEVTHGTLRLMARDFEGAAPLLSGAMAKVPENDRPRIGLRLAVALAHSGELDDAAALLATHLPNVPPSGRWYARGAEIALAAGRPGMARGWCLLAATHGATGVRLALVRARASLASRPPDQAAMEIGQLVKADADRAELHYLLALALRKQDDIGGALKAVDDAVRLAPESLPYRLLKSDLLSALGNDRAALDCLIEACALPRPGDRRARLPRLAPPDGEAAPTPGDLERRVAALRERLDHRTVMLPVVEGRVVPELFRPSWTVEDIKRRKTVAETVKSYFDVFLALILRDIRVRYSRNRLGYLWAVADPAAQILVFVGIFTLARGDRDLLGMSVPLFLVTGIMPFLLFQQTFIRINGCTKADRALLHHPHVRPMDIVLARAVLELVTVICVMTLFLLILGALGEDVVPSNLPRMAAALGLLWGAGLGLGLTVEALTPVMRFLGTLVAAVVRILYFTSGAIFSVSQLPRSVLDYMLLNPLLHAVEIVRQSFTPFAHTYGVNLAYPALAVGWLVLFGLVANRAMEKRMLEE